MTDNALFIMSEMLKTGALIAAPVLAVCLVVGLCVSILQVVTQIQEMTLTFIPKLIAAVAILIGFAAWMLNHWITFAHSMMAKIAGY